jgi:hypothetical protein
MRTESKRHKDAREFIAKLYNGVNNDNLNRKKGSYFPDVKTIDKDIEVECYSKHYHIASKVRNWDKNRKKVLILTLDEDLESLFHEIYILFNDNTLAGKEVKKEKRLTE